MTKVCVDTNALLRYLTNDIPAQAEKIENRLRQAENGNLEIYLFQINIVEVLYQMENWYKFTKKETAEKLFKLLKPEWFQVEAKQAVIEALKVYSETKIDFVDLLTWAKAFESGLQVLSFDRDFDKLSPKLRLKP